MASLPIQQLKSTLGAGARSNRFKIIIPSPIGIDMETITTLVKSTSLPTKSFMDIETHIHGKKINIAGDITFQDTWSCNFLDTEEHTLRTGFDNWMKYIDTFQNQRSADGPMSYMTDITIQQLSTIDNSVTKSYTLKYAYPKELGSVNYDQSSPELISFDVTFKFSYWE